jgi:biotin carboxylase
MTIVSLEALIFGLGRLADAATDAGHRLVLLAGNRSLYRHELSRLGPDDVEVIDVDTRDVEACGKVLAGIDDLAALVSTTDTWSLPGVELADRFGLPSLGSDTIRTLRDKAAVRNLLRDAGLSRAGALRVERDAGAIERAAAEIGYPLIVKDSAGTASRSVWLVRDDEELRRAAREAPHAALLGSHLAAEPYFPGPVYSAETVTWHGETRLLGLSIHVHTPEPRRREELVTFPVAYPDGDQAEIGQWIGRVLDTVGFTEGVAHTELALTPDGPEVIEVNARMAGVLIAEMMCRSFAVNVYDAVVDAALGRRPRLLDTPLNARCGFGMAFLHPDSPGVFAGWRGTERLPTFPGGPELFACAQPGDRIVQLEDQRGCTALLLAEGETAELGLYNVLAAAGTLTHDMRPLT